MIIIGVHKKDTNQQLNESLAFGYCHHNDDDNKNNNENNTAKRKRGVTSSGSSCNKV